MSIYSISDFCTSYSLDVDELIDTFGRLDKLVPEENDEGDTYTHEERMAALALIDPDHPENWQLLKDWIDELDGCRAEFLLTEAGLEDELDDLIDVYTSDLEQWIVVDVEATKDNLKQDYSQVDIDGMTFYSR